MELDQKALEYAWEHFPKYDQEVDDLERAIVRYLENANKEPDTAEKTTIRKILEAMGYNENQIKEYVQIGKTVFITAAAQRNGGTHLSLVVKDTPGSGDVIEQPTQNPLTTVCVACGKIMTNINQGCRCVEPTKNTKES